MPDGELFISDADRYLLVHEKDLTNFLSFDPTDGLHYITEDFDCDDFAAVLYGAAKKSPYNRLAWGLLWTNAHAMFIAVMEDHTARFIEPQTDAIRLSLEPWQGSKCRFAVV